MDAVRQHHKLAVTGKTGQHMNVNTGKSSASSKSSTSSSPKKSSAPRSHMKKSGY